MSFTFKLLCSMCQHCQLATGDSESDGFMIKILIYGRFATGIQSATRAAAINDHLLGALHFRFYKRWLPAYWLPAVLDMKAAEN